MISTAIRAEVKGIFSDAAMLAAIALTTIGASERSPTRSEASTPIAVPIAAAGKIGPPRKPAPRPIE